MKNRRTAGLSLSSAAIWKVRAPLVRLRSPERRNSFSAGPCDEVETSRSLITPIHQAWDAAAASAFPNYEAGSWGPKEADMLLGREWLKWRRL